MSGSTRRAAFHEAAAYLSMAKEFQAAAEESAAAGRWRAAGMNAIHAAISAADAVCIFEVNERSNSASHEDAADLLGRSGAADAKAKANQLGAVLDVKNAVEYQSRPVSVDEAVAVLKRSKRLVGWAATVVKA